MPTSPVPKQFQPAFQSEWFSWNLRLSEGIVMTPEIKIWLIQAEEVLAKALAEKKE